MELVPEEVSLHIFNFCGGFSPVLKLVSKQWMRIAPLVPLDSLFKLCARNGHLSLLKRMAKGNYLSWAVCETNLIEAVEGGQTEVVEWFFERGLKSNLTGLYYKAARGGHLEMMKLLHSRNVLLGCSAFTGAVEFGSLEILDWLKEINCPKDLSTFKVAVEKGDLKIISRLEENKFPMGIMSICHAANSQQPEVVVYLREKGFKWLDVMHWASMGGCLDSIKYAYENGCPLESKVLENAISNSDIEMCQWAVDNGCPYSENRGAFLESIENSGLKVCRWALQNGFSFRLDDYLEDLVVSGNLEALKWFRQVDISNGRQWNEEVTYLAMVHDQLEILQWAVRSGCPWTEKPVYLNSYLHGTEALKWGLLKGYSQSAPIAQYAVEVEDIELLQWIDKKGLEWDFWHCFEICNFSDILDWMIEKFLAFD
nr:ankyrin repeat protein [Pithovirus mammoth]